MASPFIFINIYKLKEGQQDAFKKRFRRVLDLVEAEQPRVLFFASYFNEEGTKATVLQIHPDPEFFENHMALAAEHIRSSVEHRVGEVHLDRLLAFRLGCPQHV